MMIHMTIKMVKATRQCALIWLALHIYVMKEECERHAYDIRESYRANVPKGVRKIVKRVNKYTKSSITHTVVTIKKIHDTVKRTYKLWKWMHRTQGVPSNRHTTYMIPTHASTQALIGAHKDARFDATTVYDTIHGGGRHR
jgi:archaellum component FlaF (FlaF/FlaG flagellin family)